MSIRKSKKDSNFYAGEISLSIEMESKNLEAFKFKIFEQPDAVTCGPSCLHSVYSYYGDQLDFQSLLKEVSMLEDGGTLGASLACHALKRSYRARIYTYNLRVFDPSWFKDKNTKLEQKLREQIKVKKNKKLQSATKEYLEFISLGGEIVFEDLTPNLLIGILKQNIPILTGLSATYLYHSSRENPKTNEFDDIGGEPSGHFVVLHGYDETKNEVMIADPWTQNPYSETGKYRVSLERLVGAIFLGILTYDANLVAIQPKANL